MSESLLDVWRIPVTAANAAAAAATGPQVLDQAELARAAAFRRPVDRELYLTAHVALRTLLAERLGERPEKLTFRQAPCPGCGEPHGRPEVAGPVEFSLSHAAGLAVIALADTPVGVDVEGRSAFDGPAGPDVAGMLHPDERAELELLAAAEPDRWSAAVLRCWVRKEAYLKGTGMGLGRGVGAEYVGVGPGFGPVAPLAGPDGWQLHAVEVPDGYDAAVAVRTAAAAPVRLTVRELALD
jgi:4'-phosphopantetheinyl transferase